MNEEEKAKWEARTSKYAESFNWWWRGEGWKRAVEVYSIIPLESLNSKGWEENCKILWMQMWRAAFNYELCARRKYGRKRRNRLLYEYDVPFYNLERPIMDRLLERWPTESVVEPKTKKRVAKLKFLECEARPSDIELNWLDKLHSNDERLFVSDPIQQAADVKDMLQCRATIKRRLTKEGWSISQWMRFDLRATDKEISQDFILWLKEQRKSRGIPEPIRHANKGKSRRTEGTGPPFNQIESVDLHARLTTSELKEIELDSPNARKGIEDALAIWDKIKKQRKEEKKKEAKAKKEAKEELKKYEKDIAEIGK